MLAVIGGSGLNQLSGFKADKQFPTETPFGLAAEIHRGVLNPHATDKNSAAADNAKTRDPILLFSPRHGIGHQLPPHKINYRANLWALKEAGAKHLLAVNAVGGIHEEMGPGRIVIPDQIIDYTYGREHTFFSGQTTGVQHIDFTHPFDPAWRQHVIDSVNQTSIKIITHGTYGCSQGPRLETAAEIRKLRQDGCDVVGMTGMPEAALARELNLQYCALNLVVNWGAGLTDELITMEMIVDVLNVGMGQVTTLIEAVAQRYLEFAPIPKEKA